MSKILTLFLGVKEMKMMSKKLVAQAVAAAAFALGAASVQAQTPSISTTGTGDLLLFPYYTTQNGNQTLLHMQNISENHTVLVRVRFRDYMHSRDALDFTVAMSPGDIFTGYVDGNGANGLPRWVSTDSTCTAPKTGRNGVINFPNNGNNAILSALNANKHTGHIEAIVMGVLHNPTVINDWNRAGLAARNNPVLQRAYEVVTGAKHANNEPANCDNVVRAFGDQSLVDTQNLSAAVARYSFPYLANNAVPDTTHTVPQRLNTAAGLLGVTGTGNFLAGHYGLLNAAGGFADASRLTVVKNFTANDLLPESVINPCGGTHGNLICSQTQAHWLYPNLLNVGGLPLIPNPNPELAVVGADLVADVPPVAPTFSPGERVRAFLALEQAFASARVVNEWSTNPANGVNSEIVITLPTKYTHRDAEPVLVGTDTNTYFSAPYTATNGVGNLVYVASGLDANTWDNVDSVLSGGERTAVSPALLGEIVPTPLLGGVFNASGCVDYSAVIWDREEDRATVNNVTPSGGATTTPTSMCSETNVFTFGSGVTNPTGSVNVNTSGVDQTFGWINYQFGNAVPTIGFSLWNRNFGDASKNFAQMIENIKPR